MEGTKETRARRFAALEAAGREPDGRFWHGDDFASVVDEAEDRRAERDEPIIIDESWRDFLARRHWREGAER